MKIELTEDEREKILEMLYVFFCYDCGVDDCECSIKGLIEKFGGKCQFEEADKECQSAEE